MLDGVTIHKFLLFYAGISFLAVFSWFMIFLYTRKSNYIILIATVAFGAAFYLNSFGVILHYPKAALVFLAVSTLVFYVLASKVNRLSRNLSSFSFYLFYVVGVSAFIFQVLSPLFFGWQTAVILCLLLSLAGAIGVACLLCYLWIVKQQATARFSFLAYLPYMAGFLLFAGSEMKLLPANWKIAGPAGGIIFMLLLYYGMVLYVIELRKKGKREHKEKEELIRRQNFMLEKEVAKRTQELEIERKRSEELLRNATQKQIAELGLQSLRAQLNPHFMFNVLNSIQELILKEDFEKAHTCLARFAKLLRRVLDNTEKPFLPLQKELEFLEIYLSMQKQLMPDLKFCLRINPAVDVNETMIPTMILQPYVENALKHGLSHKTTNKKLELDIAWENGHVVYRIKDNGVGRKRSEELKGLHQRQHQSRGLELLRKRYQLIREEFGSEIKADISDIEKYGRVAGTEVSILVPDSLTRTVKTEEYVSCHHN